MNQCPNLIYWIALCVIELLILWFFAGMALHWRGMSRAEARRGYSIALEAVRDGIDEIRKIASGEKQVAPDDTEGMKSIDELAKTLLAEIDFELGEGR